MRVTITVRTAEVVDGWTTDPPSEATLIFDVCRPVDSDEVHSRTAEEIIDVPVANVSVVRCKLSMALDATESTLSERTSHIGIKSGVELDGAKRTDGRRAGFRDLDHERVDPTGFLGHDRLLDTNNHMSCDTELEAMTTVLVASASVHTTAAACDYLQAMLDSDDEVLVVTVDEPDLADRDSGDAFNVARTRLIEPAVSRRDGEGEPAAVIRGIVAEDAVDELVIGPRRGDPEIAGDAPGSTTRTLTRDPPCPIVVVPL
jgi:nucleotide-binding universal stress UspA family protein